MTTTSSPKLAELRQQLVQLDALIADGVLKGDEARVARDEIERAVIHDVRSAGTPVLEHGSAGDADPSAGQRPGAALLGGVIVFVTLFGIVGYAWRGDRAGLTTAFGDPATAATPAASDTGHPVDDAQIDAMVGRLAEKLKGRPDDADGWAMLARSYTTRGRFADALPAYRRVMELNPQDAQALADYADGLASIPGGHLSGEPETLVTRALDIDPANVKALSLAGTIAFDRSDFAGAVGYWERAVERSDPAGAFALKLQDSLADARQRAGLPALTLSAAAAVPVTAARSVSASGATAGAGISGHVSIADAVMSKVAPDDTVFIFARASSGSKMPLAILRKKARDLPLDFVLDDALAMSPAARLSLARQVIVSARISKSGNAIQQPGDLQDTSGVVPVGTRGVRLEITETR